MEQIDKRVFITFNLFYESVTFKYEKKKITLHAFKRRTLQYQMVEEGNYLWQKKKINTITKEFTHYEMS